MADMVNWCKPPHPCHRCLYLSLSPLSPLYLSPSLPACLSVSLPTSLSALSACLSVSTSLSALPACLPAWLSLPPLSALPACLSHYLSALSIYLSVSLPLSPLSWSVSQSVSLPLSALSPFQLVSLSPSLAVMVVTAITMMAVTVVLRLDEKRIIMHSHSQTPNNWSGCEHGCPQLVSLDKSGRERGREAESNLCVSCDSPGLAHMLVLKWTY